MKWLEECGYCERDVLVGDEDGIPNYCIYASVYFHPDCYEEWSNDAKPVQQETAKEIRAICYDETKQTEN